MGAEGERVDRISGVGPALRAAVKAQGEDGRPCSK
jgi:hypothetical protein